MNANGEQALAALQAFEVWPCCFLSVLCLSFLLLCVAFSPFLLLLVAIVAITVAVLLLSSWFPLLLAGLIDVCPPSVAWLRPCR